MTDLDLETAGVADVRAAMAEGATTSADLVAGYLARIDALDRRGPAVHAIRCLAPDATFPPQPVRWRSSTRCPIAMPRW